MFGKLSTMPLFISIKDRQLKTTYYLYGKVSLSQLIFHIVIVSDIYPFRNQRLYLYSDLHFIINCADIRATSTIYVLMNPIGFL